MTDLPRLAGPWTHEQFTDYLRLAGGTGIDQLCEPMAAGDAAHFRAWIDDDSTCCEAAIKAAKE